jgi:hypothetical protein
MSGEAGSAAAPASDVPGTRRKPELRVEHFGGRDGLERQSEIVGTRRGDRHAIPVQGLQFVLTSDLASDGQHFGELSVLEGHASQFVLLDQIR